MAAWFIGMALTVTAGVIGTYYVLNATTFAEMWGRNDGLLQQNQHLMQELQTVQEHYDKVVAGRDDEVTKRVSEYRDSLSSLMSTRYADTLKENQDLENALNSISNGERQRAAQLKESRLSALNEALLSNSNRIAETHRILYVSAPPPLITLRTVQRTTVERSQTSARRPQNTPHRRPDCASRSALSKRMLTFLTPKSLRLTAADRKKSGNVQ
ncbi:hypothetical protein BSU01_22635 [Erwinia billingiae]|uniref:hypothetical protein n=1 Tax=Erwinia billingiae TaxID=182337 RepID=UPI0019D291FE|nr:hypothetical protein [Erwinia billingiae]MBN7124483.1 hypothetical protein [Erwinia billingiae]